MLLRSALCGCLLLASPSAALFSKSPSTTSSRSGISDALLYDSYNQLHQLSQSLPGLLDSPTIVIVGRQTDGKSALLESLMGFHFNDVGGGTKTRRPIARTSTRGRCAASSSDTESIARDSSTEVG